jgi:hypothetical protein
MHFANIWPHFSVRHESSRELFCDLEKYFPVFSVFRSACHRNYLWMDLGSQPKSGSEWEIFN